MIYNWKQEVINTSSIQKNTGILELYLQMPTFLSHDFIFSSVPRFFIFFLPIIIFLDTKRFL